MASASQATITVAPSAVATISNAQYVFATAGNGASIVFEGGSQNFISGGAITVSATGGVYAYASGAGGRVYVSNTPGGGGGNAIAAGTGAFATGLGDNVGAGALSGGVAYLSGTRGFCSMGSESLSRRQWRQEKRGPGLTRV